jgi:hypothetical protein
LYITFLFQYFSIFPADNLIRIPMSRKFHLAVFLLFFALIAQVQAQETSPPDVLRGEVFIELEPIYGALADPEYPLEIQVAGRRAMEEAALFYSAMIYGWSFHYEVGENARRIPEKLELVPEASIPTGDPRLRATDSEIKDMQFHLWTDYRLSEAQQRRVQVWRKGSIRSVQALGYCPPVSPAEGSETGNIWLEVRKAALEDAARTALRAMLRGSERNRPKEASGFISLAAFPRYYMDTGGWTASARFYVDIVEILPFAAY